ncbi:unnamed protein product [Boreogadus saida]
MEVLCLLYSVLHIRLYASVLLGLLYSLVFEGLGVAVPDRINGGHRLRPRRRTGTRSPLAVAGQGASYATCAPTPSASTSVISVGGALAEHLPQGSSPTDLMKQGETSLGDRLGEALLQSAGPAAANLHLRPKSNKRNKKNSIPRGQHHLPALQHEARMEPVSILFADTFVGFTKMRPTRRRHSAGGPPVTTLFGRFDQALCSLRALREDHERWATATTAWARCPGAQRPEARLTAAWRWAWAWIQAIEHFGQEKREMFDVWSNYVNLANLMEQLGVAGKVHLSEATANFLDDRYPARGRPGWWSEWGRVSCRTAQRWVLPNPAA